jgi:hypothetical protein
MSHAPFIKMAETLVVLHKSTQEYPQEYLLWCAFISGAFFEQRTG